MKVNVGISEKDLQELGEREKQFGIKIIIK